MRMPVDVRDLLKAGTQFSQDRDRPIRIAVLVEASAPEALLDAVELHLQPHTANAQVGVGVVGDDSTPAVTPDTDAVIALVGAGGSALAEAVAASRRRAIRTVTLTLAEDAAMRPADLGMPINDFLHGSDAGHLVADQLGAWLVDRMPAKRLALAHNFGFMRRAVALEVVGATAWQNALIGGVTIIPGTDMPLMTANQAKMLLMIAAAYGQTLGTQRIKELGAIVGGGLAFRAVARQLLDFVPGFGWVVKGAIGYSGTIAMGRAAVAYFERGDDLGEIARTLLAEGVAAVEVAREALPHRRAALPPAGAEVPYKLEAGNAERSE